MFDKINLKKFPRLDQLQDYRTVGIIVFVVIVLLVTWSGIKAVDNNYRLEKQVSALKQQNQVQKLANENLKLQNNYYNSDQYLNLAARQNFGLADPGETELIVPQNVALSYTKDLPNTKIATIKPSHSPFFVRNFKAWWNFFLGHQAGTS